MSDDPSLPPPPPPPPTPGPPGEVGSWAPAPPPAPAAIPTNAAELRGLRSLSVAVMILVGLVALVHLASIPNDLAYMSNLQDVVDGGFPDITEIEDQEDMRGMFGGLILVALIVSGIVWIVWQQRARKCARGLGSGGQRHTEPLAALSWFIPFANFVLPKQVTNDLWRASDPEGPPAMNIEGRPVSPLVDLWWALWIIGGVLGQILFRADEPETVDELDGYISTLRLELGSTLLTVVSAVIAIVIVHRITARMLTRAQRFDITV